MVLVFTLPCRLAIASSNNCEYNSKPTESMKPDWDFPKRFPAPRIERSRIAILNPEPNSVNPLIASNLFSETSLIDFSGRYMR